MKKLSLLFTLFLILDGCYFDKESELYPETKCTPIQSALYNTDIVPLLNQYCNSCHSGTFASGGIRLDGYAYVKTYVDNSKLMGSILWSSGYSPMPKNASKLSPCHIDQIQTWIDSGSLNN